MYSNIIVPVDLSDEQLSVRLLEKAVAVADKNSSIHVVSVLPDIGNSWVANYFEEGYEKNVIQKFGEELGNFIQANVPQSINCTSHVLRGSIYREVLDAAEKLKCDLIIVGAHRPELADYLIGRNAARIVRHAKTSVLVVRA